MASTTNPAIPPHHALLPSPSFPPPPAAVKFPPGCRFFPSDQHLLGYYLSNKNQNMIQDVEDNDFNCNAIQEFDLYDYCPFELPESLGFVYGKGGSKRHWFFYTVRAQEGNETRDRRVKGGGGFWRLSGKVKVVKGEDEEGVILGNRIKFEFYQQKSLNNNVKTEWVMYEYSLLDPVKAPFVVCRIYAKAPMHVTISNNAINAVAGGSNFADHGGANHENVENAGRNENNAKPIHLEMGIPLPAELLLPTDNQVPPENHVAEPVRSPRFGNEGWAYDNYFAMLGDESSPEPFLEIADLDEPLDVENAVDLTISSSSSDEGSLTE